MTTISSCEKLTSLQTRELSNRLQILKSMYNDFDSNQTHIESLCEIPDDELKERESFETNFHAAVASAEELLDKNSSFSSGRSSAGDDGSQVTGSGTAIATGPPAFKLPTIHLPTFSGRYQDWLGFHDSYTSLIHHNKSIP